MPHVWFQFEDMIPEFKIESRFRRWTQSIAYELGFKCSKFWSQSEKFTSESYNYESGFLKLDHRCHSEIELEPPLKMFFTVSTVALQSRKSFQFHPDWHILGHWANLRVWIKSACNFVFDFDDLKVSTHFVSKLLLVNYQFLANLKNRLLNF